ncbi:energy transducer TonB [Marinoscillum furvescens]|uniref:Outer membrane biosynthesis protein TonB n=1 Tax=Marinoscillum furvescens DSM 4134 TaxID=1122208 RepID=A0A3D9L0P3_MARFU|nr:hypothetical protein [Marinoscillum furvescens]RED94919.1 outer membrane biosynthesis protein TonB [Marinoscillum furvescens DSM 4134]
MADEKEKKYQRIGWISAIAAQLVMLLLFYFLIAWREPDPPIPSYGIELAFGIDNTGSGAEPVSAPEAAEAQPEEEVTEMVEETVDEPVEEVVEEAPVEPVESEPVESEPEIAETPITETPSPDVVEENAPPEPVEEVIAEEPMQEEPKKEEQVEQEQPAEEQPTEELNPEATMPKSADGDPNLNSGEEGGEGAAGKEEGTLDGRALMGEQGSSKGASLQMAGWVWDFQPQPKDNTDESGKIVYKIVVDQDGYITNIDLVSSTVSPVVERYYRQSVERLSFSKTNEYTPAPSSTGTITFIIRAK